MTSTSVAEGRSDTLTRASSRGVGQFVPVKYPLPLPRLLSGTLEGRWNGGEGLRALMGFW